MKISSKLVVGALGAVGAGAAAVAAGVAAYALSSPAEPANAKLISDYDGPHDDDVVVSGDGTRLHVRSWGPAGGPIAVLVHGWTCNVGNFPRQVEHLVGRGYRVVSYDQRGHGESEPGAFAYSTGVLADDLHAVLGTVVPAGEKALLVGHSMGGITIMAWAGKYTDEVAEKAHHAVLLSTFVRDAVPAFAGATPLAALPRVAPRLSQRLGDAVLGAPVKLRHNRIHTAVLRYSALCGYASCGAVRYTEDMVAACPPDVRGEWGHVLANADVTDGLQKLAIPTSVAVGQYDHLTPPADAELIAAELKLTGHLDRFAVIRDSGHMLPLEQPEKLNALLDSIIEGRPVTAGAPGSASDESSGLVIPIASESPGAAGDPI
ncbi:alpha/beta fold hydrolase [Tsukamurella sp. PLM1]|uniref:alpha/beta fold hydrolase n=1 Tax=Tsukamurella sp. PLM1 TaxID=2929795 RepID=UPI0020BEE214|nr:alpha/beta hydrolase [Tsukamurella sp. PLM1]